MTIHHPFLLLPTPLSDNHNRPAYCWFDNASSNSSTYGILYNWYAVETGRICPTGWHVPTDTEFETMEMSLGMSSGEVDLTTWRGTDEGSQM